MSVAVNSGAVPGFVLELAAAYAKAGIGPGKNGDSLPTGGTVTTDGAYTVHVFTASGTLIVPAGVTIPAATVLVVGGGGGSSRGGGGAGGYLTGPQVLSGSMSVAVGSGGAGRASASTVGDTGQDSVFGAYTAKGGGGGGQDSNGVAGGSGGGGGASSGAVRSGGAATPTGQGNAGGSSGSTASPYPGGGGGGAGAVGAAGAGSVGGHGGAGLYTDIIKAGTSVGYGGGGGGCTWLAGTPGTASEGGGAGKSYSTGNGLPGTANTGGGGGGAGNGSSQVGGTGGSGIVVIRYLTASCYTADWNDDSGNGNDGALANFAGTTSSGWAGSGTSADPYRCVMDGVDDIITIPDAVAMHVSTGDFTIEMWTDALNPVTGSAVTGLCYKGVHDTPSISDLAIQMTVQSMASGYGGIRSFVGVGAASGDAWVNSFDLTGRCHIVLTRTSGVCQTYFNDAVIGASFTNAADLSTIVGRWNIGPNSIQNHPLNGGVAVFRQYPFALSVAQIKQNGAAGIPVGGQGSGALSAAGSQSGATAVLQNPPLWADGSWTRVGEVVSMVDSWVQEAIVMNEGDLWEMWAHAGSGEDYDYLTAPAREGPWTGYSGNPVVAGAWQGDVVKVGSTYHMFAARGDIGTIPYRHDHLISTNKIDWTVYASDILPLGPPGAFDDWGIFNTRVLVDDDGTCYMYYDGRRQYDSFYTVGLAVAPDIDSPFVKYVGNPVLGSPRVCTGRPKVLHINGGYYMWEHGQVVASPSHAVALPTDAFRAYAPSPYGPWTLDPVARLVRTGSDEGEGMPQGQIADCHVMVDGDTLLMYYTANSNGSGVGPTNGPSVIKLATAPLITEAGAAELAGVGTPTLALQAVNGDGAALLEVIAAGTPAVVLQAVNGSGAALLEALGEGTPSIVVQVVSGSGEALLDALGADTPVVTVIEPIVLDVPIPGISVVATLSGFVIIGPLTIDVPVPDLEAAADQIEWVYVNVGPVTIEPPDRPYIEVGGPTIDRPVLAPAALAGYATGVTIQLTTKAGLVVDLGPLHENLQTGRARKFGFESCSFELPSYSVMRNYPELQAMTDVLVVRDGVTVFEGRITDPGVQLTETDARRMVTCRGYCDGLSDDETVRRMYADSDPSAWRSFMPAPAHDFGVSASATGLVAQAKWGSTYASDAWGGLCYRIFGGIMKGDAVNTLKAHFRWNGKLDPKRIKTAETPGYNLFPDPRNLSGSQVWQIDDTDIQVGPVTAQKMLSPGGSVLTTAARCFLWDSGTWASAPEGFEYWGCSMALPSDVQADAQIAGGTTMLASMFTAGSQDGDGMLLLCRDADGNVLTSGGVSLPADSSWEFKYLFLEAPAATAEVVLMMGLAVGGTAWRRVCFPLVSNYKAGVDDSYHDGFSKGWEWSSAANNSPSRETDLSVTERVFALLKSYNHGDPIYATIFAADDPDGVAKELAQGGKQAVAYQVLHEWHSNAKSSGDISLDVGRYGVGLRIGTTSMQASISAMPPALTFNPPATGNSPEPYGLTLSNLILIGEGTSVIDAIKHLARGYVASARQLVFDEDPANVTFNQLVFADATTDAAILQSLDAMLDWEYGFEDKGRFYYANPALIAADPRRVYQIPYSLAAPSLTRQIDDVCNGVEVSWTQKDGTQAAITVTRQSPCLPKGMRKIHEVAMSQPGQRNKSCDMSAAKALAKAYLDQHTKPQITGQMPLTGRLVQDGTGAWRSVLSIMEGEYVRLTEAPPEEQDDGLLLITRVSIDHTTLQTTLEVGMNRKRLDRLLARMDATIVRR